MLSKKTALFFSLFLLVAGLLVSSPVLAQSTATLQGTVTDSKGAVIPNATVTVRNRSTSFERTTQTDTDGNYQVAALPVGTYTVEAKIEGFKTQVADHVTVEVAKTVIQNFQMDVGAISEHVQVSSDVPVIETATTSVGTVINQRTVQEIPLNGRHFVDLGLLIPGSVTPPQNGFLTAPLRGQGSFAFNTAGAREDTVNFMINGVNLNDMVQNQITFQPSINTVQEFKADNSTFSAEYGRNSGAIVNIATRSGTNEYHGELFEFLRNDIFDARNFFERTNDPAPFKRNQFGFNLGGPLNLPHFGEGGPVFGYNGKNRTFFFFSYEGLRQRQGLTIAGVTVPTDAQRAAVTDPVILQLLPLIPRANVGASGFSGSATAPVDLDQWTIDVNHNLGVNDRLHGYYAIQRDERGEPTLQGNSIPGFGDTRQSRRQIFTLNETHTFGAAVVNEVRFGFNRIHISFTPNAQLNPLDFGIRNGVTEPIGLPQILVTGTGLNFGGPAGFPQGRSDTTFVVSDTLSYLRGNHSFRFGGEWRRFYNNNTNKDTGTFAFANMAAFLNGTANAFNITLGDLNRGITDVSTAIAQGALGFFVQDNYKIRPNLTLELGFRYDWLMSPTERYDRFVDYVPEINSLVRVNNGIAPVYQTNATNFQPRLGFAWDPFKDGKTSVRGAYAILADQPVTNLVTGNATNPPFATSVALPANTTTQLSNATSNAVPGATVSPSSSDPGFNNGYVQSWNLNVQREIGQGLAVTVGYFGSKGTNLRITRNLNQTFLNAALNPVRPFPTLSPTSPIRPGAPLLNITFREGTSNSNYNALWLTATKRMSKGLQFNASYTFSKSIDYNSQSSQGVTVQDSYNLRGDRGLSDFDARHRFVVSGLYELPFSGNQLKEGWQLSFITQSQSGNPVTLLAGNAGALAGGIPAANANSLTGLATLRPDVSGPVTISSGPAATGIGVQWFPNQVCDPRPGGSCPSGATVILPVGFVGGKTIYHFGSMGRNVIIGPRFNNTDISLIKRTKLSENQLIEFRWEVFDVFNHANFGQPGRVAQVGSTAFGVITNTRFPTGDSGSSRQMQFALKYKF
ncbi:MAG TPA: carboxypeptidase regulatory-like domain-containing protein [Pyrinomonadaceae bacterium]|nr:carboxypeptidase regulatory-like domain-containing protein [Pyrinomonadaceae bacterium]